MRAETSILLRLDTGRPHGGHHRCLARGPRGLWVVGAGSNGELWVGLKKNEEEEQEKKQMVG